MAMTVREDVRIPSHAEQLAAYVYRPDSDAGDAPCVVMAHGWSATRDDGLPGYAEAFTKIGRERGWPPTTRAHFEALRGPSGALLVSDPDTVVEKLLHFHEVLGGIARLSFQMSVAALPHAKLMHAIELLGTRVAPAIRKHLPAGAMAASDPR